MAKRIIKKQSFLYRIYSNPMEIVTDTNFTTSVINISGSRDFVLDHIRVYVPDYAANFRVQFQDNQTDKNWQTVAVHVSAITNQAGVIPFRRLLVRTTNITVKMYNNSGADALMQVNLMGHEIGPRIKLARKKK